MNNIQASIILRTKNEEKYVGKVLAKIKKQKYVKSEIIAIDSGSTDKTLTILKKNNVKTICIEPDEFTFGSSLNIGAKNARGKYLISLSAHAVPVNDEWLSKLISGFSDKRIAGIYGRQLPLTGCNPLIKRDLYKGYGVNRKVQCKDPFFSNANSSVRRDLWERLPFDEKLAGSEDYYWAKKVQEKKFMILYEPDAAVYHSHNESLKTIYRRSKRELRAIKTVDCDSKYLFNFYKLMTRLMASILMDYRYLIKNKDNLKWYFYSIVYRMILLWGKYAGSR